MIVEKQHNIMFLTINETLKKRLYKQFINTCADISNFTFRFGLILFISIVFSFLMGKWTYSKLNIGVPIKKLITP